MGIKGRLANLSVHKQHRGSLFKMRIPRFAVYLKLTPRCKLTALQLQKQVNKTVTFVKVKCRFPSLSLQSFIQ